MPRVLLLHVTVGTGHKRAAEALYKAFDELQPGKVQIEDVLDHTPRFFSRAYADAYIELSDHAALLWGYFYNQTRDDPDVSRIINNIRKLVEGTSTTGLKKVIKAFDPDIIICTHFLPMELLANLKRHDKLSRPVYCVITDYVAHTFWTYTELDGYFVGNAQTRAQLIERGIPASRITVSGIPIDPAIAEPKEATAMRQRHGFALDAPLITLFGGGIPAEQVRAAAMRMLQSTLAGTLVIVAGRNKTLTNALHGLEPGATLDLRLLGFIDYVDDLVTASDLVITKAGGLIVSEVLARGTPLLVTNPTPGHEDWNADAVVSSGAGLQVRMIEAVPETVQRLFQQPHRLADMRSGARAAGHPRAACEIARRVIDDCVAARNTHEQTSSAHSASAPTPARVLFAISDTGSGHRSAALAIKDALDEVSGGSLACALIDILRISGVPGLRNAPALYDHLSTRWLGVYNFSFHLTNSVRSIDMISRLIYLQARRSIGRALMEANPHLVVVTHPLVHRLVGAARRTYRLPFRIVTVVTDLVSLHASWTYSGVDLCLLPTDEAYDLMLQRGMDPSRMVRTGFPVHQKFARSTRTKTEARQELGISPSMATILITSGGVGSGHMQALVLELEQRFPTKQLLVVTGKNQALCAELQAARKHEHTHIYGFVHHMETLMAASDMVVSKAGPGTLMEALVMRRPVLVTEAVGIQEQGNIDFVLNHELGYFCPTTERLVSAIRALEEPDTYAATVERSRHVPHDGAAQIAALLLEQLQATPMPPGKPRRRLLIPPLRSWHKVLRYSRRKPDSEAPHT